MFLSLPAHGCITTTGVCLPHDATPAGTPASLPKEYTVKNPNEQNAPRQGTGQDKQHQQAQGQSKNQQQDQGQQTRAQQQDNQSSNQDNQRQQGRDQQR